MAKKKQSVSLETWMRAQAGAMREKYGPVEEFRLMHIVSGGQLGQAVETVPVSPEATDETIQSIAEQLKQTAAADAETLGKFQKYVVLSMFMVDGELTAQARYTFAQDGGGDEEDGGFETEPPTMLGQLAQTQRHLEAVMRMSTVATQQALATLVQQNNALGAQVEKMVDEKFKSIEMMAELYDKKEERQIKAQEQQQQFEVKKKIGENLLPMIQVVAAKMLGGGKLLPSGESPMKSALKQFASGLTQEQLEKMVEPLNDGQKMLVVELMQSAMEEAQQPTDEKKEANNVQ